MTCARYVEPDAAERYVLGQMTESEQSAFEEHYFACDDCFEAVRALQDLQGILRNETPQPHATGDDRRASSVPSSASPPPNASSVPAARASAPAAKTSSAPIPIETGRKRGRSPLLWVGLAAAASVLIALVIWQRQPASSSPALVANNDAVPRTEPPPTPTPAPPSPTPPPSTAPPSTPPARPAIDLAALALVVPPPYVQLQARGADAESRAEAFRAAMTHYTAKDYRAAAEALTPLVDETPGDGRAAFFLGVSRLMTGQTAAARTALDRAVQSGTAPFASEAHFYLAKAALRDRDLARAERELTLADEQEAGPPGEAARLLRQVRAARTAAQ